MPFAVVHLISRLLFFPQRTAINFLLASLAHPKSVTLIRNFRSNAVQFSSDSDFPLPRASAGISAEQIFARRHDREDSKLKLKIKTRTSNREANIEIMCVRTKVDTRTLPSHQPETLVDKLIFRLALNFFLGARSVPHLFPM
jgi:hypothetical protein